MPDGKLPVNMKAFGAIEAFMREGNACFFFVLFGIQGNILLLWNPNARRQAQTDNFYFVRRVYISFRNAVIDNGFFFILHF